MVTSYGHFYFECDFIIIINLEVIINASWLWVLVSGQRGGGGGG